MLTRAFTQPLDSPTGNREEAPCLKRRNFLKLAAVSIGGLAAASPALARVAIPDERILSFYNPVTDEFVRTVYWTPREGYVPESLREINWALRDYRTEQVKSFDPRLLDILYALQLTMDYRQPFHVISGYRSPATNAMLRRQHRDVARNSYHMYAMAADIRMPERSVAELHRAALSLNAGGVGYYPYANFVHVDTGPIRTWG